ncbi:hypothetical protein ACHAWF_004420 [Thalassiosira exigua]
MYYHRLYPDALSNVVHGYAELDERTDEEIRHVHEVKLSARKESPTSEDDYDEDPFFHALLHNNNDRKVVTSSRKPTKQERLDTELFEKLHDKLFHHDDGEDQDEHGEKVTYGLREAMKDVEFFE